VRGLWDVFRNATKNALRNGLNRCNPTASFEHADLLGD
jgi:hypothetical protein